MENSEIKILGSGKFFDNIKEKFEEFKNYLNERPHKIEKSPEHPFGGYSTKHGLKDFSSKVLAGAFMASFTSFLVVATVNQIENQQNLDTENKSQSFIEIMDNKNRIFRVVGSDMKLMDQEGNKVELNSNNISSFIEDIKGKEAKAQKNKTKLKIGK